MGNRPQRIFAEQLSREAILSLQGRLVEVVLQTGVTFTGWLQEVRPDGLVLQDLNARWYNRGNHLHRLAFSEVQELVVLQTTGY